MLWIVRLLLPLVLPIPAGMLAAQEPAPAPRRLLRRRRSAPARDLDPVVPTATKLETAPNSSAPRSRSSPATTRKYHFETGRRAPQRARRRDPPGRGIGKVSNISIRGANANQVQVLVDGVRVKSATTGRPTSPTSRPT